MGMDAGARPIAAGRADERAALESARFHLLRTAPHFSAKRRLTYVQMAAFAAFIGLATWWVLEAPGAAWLAAQIAAATLFICAIFFRLFAAAACLAPPPRSAARWAQPLPRYTLLCPLFKEADVIGDFVAAIRRLDYPPHLLDVKIILEDDDVETIAVVEDLALAAPFDVIVTPSEGPQTKPKALNYALAFADGDFIAVYDAEDAPDPAQLKAALDAFAAGGPTLACVQAPLLVDNPRASWIASQFAVEYAIQFRAILPLLARMNLPLPLGGTSNHFRRAALEQCGAWDPYNVTEDADLGYRLARHGWRTGVIDRPTWEEAPVKRGAWMNQRTRWIKGHMQTWLVHMRQPFRTAREMGAGAFLSMQLLLFGGIAAAFLHGPIALVIAACAIFQLDWLGQTGIALAVSGYAAAFYAAIACAAMLNDWRIARAGLTAPLYWPLATIAACRALYELALRPHHWQKTEHGVSERKPRPAGFTARAA